MKAVGPHLFRVAALLFATAAFGAPADQLPAGFVRFSLVSEHAGRSVAPGQEVRWTVRAFVSPLESQGLAFFSFDLVPDATNPAPIELSPADPAPEGMRAFDRPRGFANPGSDPHGSGYGGTPVGPDLVQVGGAQNTFGFTPACFGPDQGICLGTDIDPVRGVGQTASDVVLASGTFTAPDVPGSYTLRLTRALASTLRRVNIAPQPSEVGRAPVLLHEGGELTFEVQP